MVCPSQMITHELQRAMSPCFPWRVSAEAYKLNACVGKHLKMNKMPYILLSGALLFTYGGGGCPNKLEVLVKCEWWEWGLSVCLCITVRWQATRNLRITTKPLSGNFPGGPMVKNLPSSAEDSGSTPDWGTKIPYVMGQLSPCATTTEHTNSEARGLQLEKPGRCNKDPTYRS